MNVLKNSVLIFIFIFLSLIIGTPDFTHNDNLIKNKLFLFIGIFIFQLLIKSIYKLKNKGTKNIDIKAIIKDSILVALFSIIGLSLYFDIITMECTKNYITSFMDLDNINSRSLLISFVISVFIFASIIINIVVNNNYDELK